MFFLIDNVFYKGNLKLFVLERTDYILYSVLKLIDENGMLILKCKVNLWGGYKSLKILKKNLSKDVSIIKKGNNVFFNVLTESDSYEIDISSANKYSPKFKVNFYLNNQLIGSCKSKTNFLRVKYLFEFDNISNEKINHCLMFFALKYYSIDDTA